MSTAQLAKYIGKEGSLLVSEGFRVDVQIVDVKMAYGNLRFEVLPVRGENTGWVDASRVRGVSE